MERRGGREMQDTGAGGGLMQARGRRTQVMHMARIGAGGRCTRWFTCKWCT